MAGINYAVSSNWGSGFVADMTVPGGSQSLTGWTIEFDASFDISDIWGAAIVSHVGDHYVISNADWNADIASGSQATFGFQATPGAGGTALSGLVLDGAGNAPPPPLPAISIAGASVSEGNSGTTQLSFVVTLSQAAPAPVAVHYATADGTATAGSDYTAQSGTLTFAAGETSKTIDVPVIGDTVVEANETLTVTLSTPSGAAIAQASATGTIVNDDVPAPPAVGAPALDYNILSNWGSGFTGTMRVEAGSDGLDGWTVGFDSTATIGNIWGADIVSHVGNHYVVGNAGWNGEVGPRGSAVFGFQATTDSGDTAATGFTINDIAVGNHPAPPLPALSVGDASVTEGNSGTQDLAFTVTLSAQATTPVTVAYATGDGTAIAGSDYTSASGTLTFAPGQTTEIVDVQVTGDTAIEGNETLTLNLSSPNGATIADGTATGTIINDDVAPPPPPPPPPTIPTDGLGGQLTVTDSWSGGFNASVDVHNGGATPTAGWQIAIDMPYQITNIWNATIISHDANGYVIASAPYNGQIGANGDTSFGFTANGQVDPMVISVQNVGTQSPAIPTTPTPPSPPTVTSDPNHMFSPYIDMAMPQDDALVAISQASGIQNFTVAFMLSSPEGIGWQGQGSITDDTLANGSTILQQVQAIQAMGGNITISFGGAAGQEAALTAPSAATLQAEYQSVIDRYQVNTIDFDIEGAAELDQHSLQLRDQAIVGLQAANPDLKVSFTVPVLPTGLDASGLNVLQIAKNDGVRTDTVNIMTMDYGQDVDNNGQMGQDAISAAIATERQLADMGLVAKIGVTPMIGVNDIASEVFTPADAQSLVDYAKTDSQLALLSMWSVARDNGSGAGSHAAAPDNSGVAQQPYQYAGILHQFDHQG